MSKYTQRGDATTRKPGQDPDVPRMGAGAAQFEISDDFRDTLWRLSCVRNIYGDAGGRTVAEIDYANQLNTGRRPVKIYVDSLGGGKFDVTITADVEGDRTLARADFVKVTGAKPITEGVRR